MEIKTSQKTIISAKNRKTTIIRWIELDTYNLFSYPFKQIKKFTIASIYSKSALYCNICNKEKELLFSFLTKKKLSYFKFDKWFKFCYDCSLPYLLLLKAKGMTDECLDVLKFFIEAEKNFHSKMKK